MSLSTALRELYAAVTRRIDGENLVRSHRRGRALSGPTPHVLAVGKAALPMARGALGGWPPPPDKAAGVLLVGPERLLPSTTTPSPGVRVLAAEHPDPGPGSLFAAAAARDFVSAVPAQGRLLVLLSGGASSLLCAPAAGLTLADKRDAIRGLARAGVAIRELNVVRKHLSSVKGGRLGALLRAPATVLLLSDVLGDDPAIIGSGPFSPDPSTYAEALLIVRDAYPDAPAAVLAHLEAGASGSLAETPKPGDARLRGVKVKIVAGPAVVHEQAVKLARAADWQVRTADTDTALPVGELAAHVVERARTAAPGAAGGQGLLVVGNGEPTLRVTGGGRGGRSTHLALLVARGLHDLPPDRRAAVAFLAAGTDDRDGSAGATGAVVDGNSWQQALDAGLDPQAAIDHHDSYRLLERLGACVQGPGTSNLLDLHLMAVSSKSSGRTCR